MYKINDWGNGVIQPPQVELINPLGDVLLIISKHYDTIPSELVQDLSKVFLTKIVVK